MNVADAIAFARRRAGLSARAVSLAAGLSPGYVSRLEAGAMTDPSLRAFARIAVVVGLSIREVWCCVATEAAHAPGEGSSPPNPPSPRGVQA